MKCTVKQFNELMDIYDRLRSKNDESINNHQIALASFRTFINCLEISDKVHEV